MMPPDGPDRQLTTWAEIAAYLGVTQRTAQIWRKERGLPVGRLGGRVVANTAELDRWKASAEPIASAPATADNKVTNRPARHHALIALAAATLIVLAAGAWWFTANAKSGGKVVRVATEGNTLVAYNDRAERAWTYGFDHALDDPPATYPARSLLYDIDDDGETEVLFVAWSGGSAKGLYCFRSGGQLAWMSPFGRTVVDDMGVVIVPDYAPVELLVLRKARPDGGRVVVLTQHRSNWPSQIAVLTAQGEVVAEHWHAGPLWDMASADLERDGIEELLFGGLNLSCRHSRGAAVLFVLDFDFGSGQGPASAERPHFVTHTPAGVPAAALTLPEPPGDRSETRHAFPIDQIRWNGEYVDVRQRASAPELDVHYRFNRRLELVSATPGTGSANHIGGHSKESANLVASGIEVFQNRFTLGKVKRE
jgi:hypothetical protein